MKIGIKNLDEKKHYFFGLIVLTILIATGVSTGTCEKKVEDAVPENGTNMLLHVPDVRQRNFDSKSIF